MAANTLTIGQSKRIALVAHDHMKDDLLTWAGEYRQELERHSLVATGTTGRMLREELGLPVTLPRSGPLGGDLQIGARIVDGEVDFLIFFWDPLQPQPHDPDVKALPRVAVVWNIPVANNRSSADFMLTSPLMSGEYQRSVKDYSDYRALIRGERGPGSGVV